MTVPPDVLEANYLDRLWAVQYETQAERLQVLRDLAAVVIQRAADWDYAAIRLEEPYASLDEHCFCCRNRGVRLYRHHAVQLQHGGSNSARNVVKLCHRCHQAVHPWLHEATSMENRRGWTWVGDWARRLLDILAGKDDQRHLP